MLHSEVRFIIHIPTTEMPNESDCDKLMEKQDGLRKFGLATSLKPNFLQKTAELEVRRPEPIRS